MLTHVPANGRQAVQFPGLRRNGIFNIAIANRLGISRLAVSRALLLMDDRIERFAR